MVLTSFQRHLYGTLTADGTEQLVAEIAEPARVSGYISLSKMAEGDTVFIRQYMKLLNGSYEKYAEERYSDAEPNPVIYVKPKEVASVLRVTLQQTAGAFKNFDYTFVKEVEKPTSIGEYLEKRLNL